MFVRIFGGEKMSDEQKTLIFNPAGFILKIILCIAYAVYDVKFIFSNGGTVSDPETVKDLLNLIIYVPLLYCVLSLFGFSLKATGNYIIAAILWIVILCIMILILDKIGNFINSFENATQHFLVDKICMVLVAAAFSLPFIRDVRKAVIYIKNTV